MFAKAVCRRKKCIDCTALFANKFAHKSSWIPERHPVRTAFGQNRKRTNARTGINEAL
ncbi:hypothetical protein KPSA1_07307 [Pseudomonas syringae pv. actinidiae]|uniref:Uncharacterized protein n=1 Tax=Pseudomonas syringae pv. actinidiae TaxID=103796 RepID=A0A2V0QLP5_PSESF|nr:hypothetical protein KPSA1_07307 [Pseudomonas syringae pv. actinidiae]